MRASLERSWEDWELGAAGRRERCRSTGRGVERGGAARFMWKVPFFVPIFKCGIVVIGYALIAATAVSWRTSSRSLTACTIELTNAATLGKVLVQSRVKCLLEESIVTITYQ